MVNTKYLKLMQKNEEEKKLLKNKARKRLDTYSSKASLHTFRWSSVYWLVTPVPHPLPKLTVNKILKVLISDV